MTKTSQTDGVMFDGAILRPARLTLRYTYDEKGSTISLSNEQNLMLQVDFAAVKQLVEQADLNHSI